MNKKGFTLVELLAVVVLIGVISVVAVVSMNGVKGNIDLKLVNGNLSIILTTAKSYGEDHSSALPVYKKVSELKSEGLEVGSEYDNVGVLIYTRNRRATACIDFIGDDSVKAIKDIVGDSNKCNFSELYCPFWNFYSGNSFNGNDVTTYNNTYKGKTPSIVDGVSTDIDGDGANSDLDKAIIAKYWNSIKGNYQNNTTHFSKKCQ